MITGNIKKLALALCAGAIATVSAMGETVTYRIVEYNTDTETFTLSPAGMRPEGSWAWFDNEYGATTGNRYNQIPRNREASLVLEGWQGCTINSISMQMCSNNTAGTMSWEVALGDSVAYKVPTAAFNDDQWASHWVSKDLNLWVDINKTPTTPITVGQDQDVTITIKGGTQEGSVYVNSITIDYDTPGATESALGWKFERVASKATFNDGDVIMIYRSGNAAGDIDGMETSHYLDAIGVASTTSVDDPLISLFTLHKTDDNHWTMTNQHGQMLGARAAQNLAWDEGVTTWDLTSGYDGVTIASTNSKYGTIRFNAPSGSYARFWNYTSTSLSLPNVYRRTIQQQPVISTSLTLSETERTVALEQDTIVIYHTLLPATVTDRRITWSSSNENVLRVNGGMVLLVGEGTATVTARAADGGCEASCIIHVGNGSTALVGDVDGNGVVDVMDVNILINIILGADQASNYNGRADVNNDATIDINDVNDVINIILQ